MPGETCISGSCMCGRYESCTKHVLDETNNPLVAGNVTCDALESTCKCNNDNACSESQVWCTNVGCKCSQNQDTYTIGDDASQGTCTLASDVCTTTGNCDGE